MSGGVTFTIECEKCGTANRVLPSGVESDPISCNACEAEIATVGQLNDEIVRQIQSIMTDGIKARLHRLLAAPT